MRSRQPIIVFVAIIMIWAMMPNRGPGFLSRAPELASGFSPLGGPQLAAAQAAPAIGLSVMGPPTITPAQIEAVLKQYNSPAAGQGQEIYNIAVRNGINPAISLAFFIQESGAGSDQRWAGLKPDGSTTKNIGNIICTPGYRCYGRFRDYATWAEGIEDWNKLIKELYVGEWGRTTVEQIIPKYAPAADSNDEGAYIASVKRLVEQWQGATPK